MSTNSRTDVLVVGAGPVGLLTAIVLAEAGVKVTIIESEYRPATHSYACGLHPRSLAILAHLGLLKPVLLEARRLDRVAFYSSQGRETEATFAPLPVEYPFLLVLPQNRLEALLAERLTQLGCEVLWHHRLSTLHFELSCVTAEIDQVVGTATGSAIPHWDWVVGRTTQLVASYVVGADGHHSMVRRLTGIENEHLAPAEHYVVYEFASAARLDDEVRVVADGATKSVLWPLTDGKCRWSFQVAKAEVTEFGAKDRSRSWSEPAQTTQRTLERLRNRLKEHAPWFKATPEKVDWAVDIQFQHRLAKRYGRDRCWLAGDAAHQTAPAGIQSMNVGFLEAQDLATVLSRVILQNESPDQLLDYERTYQREWQRLLGSPNPALLPVGASRWLQENYIGLLTSIPASGDELNLLLGQIGLKARS